MSRLLRAFTIAAAAFAALAPRDAGAAELLRDQDFELPSGFHIYRAAPGDLSGGSYAMTFDGQGRLLVGDGERVRRLTDGDGDGVYDAHEVVATGLGPRGPQGLLVYGEHLYAVGGDGVQKFLLTETGEFQHQGRIGGSFRTGGDHTAHTLLRGIDGFIYLVVGDGAGGNGTAHITETTSPVRAARNASVFRFNPEGDEWECISTGGRNAPSLGMNALGDLFSLDSDMEWHVGLPWYRPVRLNHWAWGADQGWEQVGAREPYFLDAVPGILDVGRGSPDWGVFYEHHQFPERYYGTFFVCDYRWKSEAGGDYDSSGRLLAFDLEQDGAGWKAEMEVFAASSSKDVSFALVDIAVAPDGSILLSDHNQGIWRVFYDERDQKEIAGLPPLSGKGTLPSDQPGILDAALSAPQLGSEWSRLRIVQLEKAYGEGWGKALEEAALDSKRSLGERIQAVRLLGANFKTLPSSTVRLLSGSDRAELRGQAAWLVGLRNQPDEFPILRNLQRDRDGFVRRRVAEALTRSNSEAAIPLLLGALSDAERLIRHVAMAGLSRFQAERWLARAMRDTDPQARMRALTAALARDEAPEGEALGLAIEQLLLQVSPFEGREQRLDLLRLISLFRSEIENQAPLRETVIGQLLSQFPDDDDGVRWEQARVLGELRASEGFESVVEVLLKQRDPVAQFYYADVLSQIPGGWDAESQAKWIDWLLQTQAGWFAEFADKGRQFPDFWLTILSRIAEKHSAALLRRSDEIQWSGLVGASLLPHLAREEGGFDRLTEIFGATRDTETRRRILRIIGESQGDKEKEFLTGVFARSEHPEEQGVVLLSIARRPMDSELTPLLLAGLDHQDPDVVNACALALLNYPLSGSRDLFGLIIERFGRSPWTAGTLERLLEKIAGAERPGVRDDERRRPARASEEELTLAKAFWTDWYASRFGEAIPRPSAAGGEVLSDVELREFLIGDGREGGSSDVGKEIFERLQCHSCHGGVVGAQGQIFGPDMAGVWKRLGAGDLADALVYPSLQVAERFRATEIELTDGTTYSGFITEKGPNGVTLVTQDQARSIVMEEIRDLRLPERSLMPEGLLSTLRREELRDLMAFLREL